MNLKVDFALNFSNNSSLKCFLMPQMNPKKFLHNTTFSVD